MKILNIVKKLSKLYGFTIIHNIFPFHYIVFSIYNFFLYIFILYSFFFMYI